VRVGCYVSKGKEDEGGISTAPAKEVKAKLKMFCKPAMPSCKISRMPNLFPNVAIVSHHTTNNIEMRNADKI
jgi:hypothetical protein